MEPHSSEQMHLGLKKPLSSFFTTVLAALVLKKYFSEKSSLKWIAHFASLTLINVDQGSYPDLHIQPWQ